MKGELKMGSVLDNITVLYDQLFDAEKKIAKYILNNPKEIFNWAKPFKPTLRQNLDTDAIDTSGSCRKYDSCGY